MLETAPLDTAAQAGVVVWLDEVNRSSLPPADGRHQSVGRALPARHRLGDPPGCGAWRASVGRPGQSSSERVTTRVGGSDDQIERRQHQRQDAATGSFGGGTR